MVLVSVLYPNQAGSRFDERYYMDKHIPLVRQRWGAMGLTDLRVLRGTGTPDGGPASFRVMALLTFSSADALQKAAAAHGAELFGDIPNFTDVQPVAQVNEALA
ncbi:MAG: EthD family reductase [Acetobacteraceae bacterium]|nr:EthD family reductase [Acetobacteraceae bacterium]